MNGDLSLSVVANTPRNMAFIQFSEGWGSMSLSNVCNFMWHEGMFTWKPLGHDCGGSFNSHWLRVPLVLAQGLHEGIIWLHSITFAMDEKSTWNPTWQVWIMLAGMQGIFSGWLLKVDWGGMCDGPQGYNSRQLFINTYSDAIHV